jgi:hypothetical protein
LGRHTVDLTKFKLEVWRYIDSIGPTGSDLELPDGRAARALLCVLEPTGDWETEATTAEWVAAMLDGE